MKNTPSSNSTILEQMEKNFNNSYKTMQTNQNAFAQNESQNTNQNANNNFAKQNNLFGGMNISNILPLLNGLNGGKNMDFQSLLANPELSKMLGGSKSNPMISQLLSSLPNFASKKSAVKQLKQEKNEPKIDSFVKVDDYNIE